MQVNLYDTHAGTADGALIRSNVVIPAGIGNKAHDYALSRLGPIGIAGVAVPINRCVFCHGGATRQEVGRPLARGGYFAVKMGGRFHSVF